MIRLFHYLIKKLYKIAYSEMPHVAMMADAMEFYQIESLKEGAIIKRVIICDEEYDDGTEGYMIEVDLPENVFL